jgi:hypothetical protein
MIVAQVACVLTLLCATTCGEDTVRVVRDTTPEPVFINGKQVQPGDDGKIDLILDESDLVAAPTKVEGEHTETLHLKTLFVKHASEHVFFFRTKLIFTRIKNYAACFFINRTEIQLVQET